MMAPKTVRINFLCENRGCCSNSWKKIVMKWSEFYIPTPRWRDRKHASKELSCAPCDLRFETRRAAAGERRWGVTETHGNLEGGFLPNPDGENEPTLGDYPGPGPLLTTPGGGSGEEEVRSKDGNLDDMGVQRIHTNPAKMSRWKIFQEKRMLGTKTRIMTILGLTGYGECFLKMAEKKTHKNACENCEN